MINKEIGQRIRKLRISHGISMDELSSKLGITQGFLGLVERGERGASVRRLVAFSEIFNVSLDYLVSGKDNPVAIMGNTLNEHNLHKYAKFIKALSEYSSDKNEVDLLFDVLYSQLNLFHFLKSQNGQNE